MIRDLRIGIQSQPNTAIFANIAAHNRHVRDVIADLAAEFTTATPGRVKKTPDGIQTVLRCGTSRKIFVKTLKDGSTQRWEER